MITEPEQGEELADVFFSAAHALRRIVNARCGDAGLSMARVKVLLLLQERGEQRMGELSQELDVAARTMTSTIDGMVRDGLVERRPDELDRRAVVVALTGEGRRAVGCCHDLKREAIAELFDVLDEAQRAQLLTILRLLTEAALLRAEPVAEGTG